jgi:polyphosphate kinase
VRLEVAQDCPDKLMRYLLERFELGEEDLYRVNGPVNLHRLAAIWEIVDRPDLKYARMSPRVPKRFEQAANPFAWIRAGDVVLHHPFESFLPVVELVRTAAQDPDVLAIKQTLYRTGKDSPFVEALIEAARNGKEVTSVIELRARFDEAANIQLATRLQEAGVKVVYGVVGYKTHAKLLLIVRRENARLVNYVHLSTGNYHAGTAKAYTDIGLLSADVDLAEDVQRLFTQLTGLGRAARLKRLRQAPFTLQKSLVAMIDQEADHARAGRPARIIAKMNALAEPKVIQALYRASQAGVEIDLIVRGVCCLRPGVPGISERIRVRSIVGRFLEHSRVYWLQAGGEGELYCSSADWMQRNFYTRIEVAFPMLDRELAARVRAEALEPYLADNTQAWVLQADGKYRRLKPGNQKPRCAQDELLANFGCI